jgi:hypothetical protein
VVVKGEEQFKKVHTKTMTVERGDTGGKDGGQAGPE